MGSCNCSLWQFPQLYLINIKLNIKEIYRTVKKYKSIIFFKIYSFENIMLMYNGLITAILNKLTFKQSLVFISIIKNINGYSHISKNRLGLQKVLRIEKVLGPKSLRTTV